MTRTSIEQSPNCTTDFSYGLPNSPHHQQTQDQIFALYHSEYGGATTMLYVGQDKAQAFDILVAWLQDAGHLSGRLRLFYQGDAPKKEM